MAVFVTGERTTIVAELKRLLPAHERVITGHGNLASIDSLVLFRGLPINCERYVFAQGLLRPLRFKDQTAPEVYESITVNCLSVMRMCEHVLDQNGAARICIIGSESGFKGSYDETYAVSKAALHRYVETRALAPQQQLVCLAPGMIRDSGMTARREDQDRVQMRADQHPKRRLLTAEEVAKAVYFLLFEDRGYITNTVVRMDGKPAVSH